MVPLATRVPSFTEYRLAPRVMDNYIATNASVAVLDGQIFALIPAMDHWVNNEGRFLPLPPGSPEHRYRYAHNRTYLARLSTDLAVEYVTEIFTDVPATPWDFRGFESPRLFVWRGALWATLCTHGASNNPGAQSFIGRIDGASFAEVRRVTAGFMQFEKNLMPEVIGDDLRFHYRLGTLLPLDGVLAPIGRPDLAHFHGGSQVIPYKDGGLCIVHHYGENVNSSWQHFVTLDADGRPQRLSEAFNFQRDIATGIAYHPDGKRLMISYGRQDETAGILRNQETPFIATVDIEELGRVI
jgi:hypothetical protein